MGPQLRLSSEVRGLTSSQPTPRTVDKKKRRRSEDNQAVDERHLTPTVAIVAEAALTELKSPPLERTELPEKIGTILVFRCQP